MSLVTPGVLRTLVEERQEHGRVREASPMLFWLSLRAYLENMGMNGRPTVYGRKTGGDTSS